MPILDLVDPRLAALAANSGRVAASDLARARAHYHDLVEAVSSPPNSHVSVRDVVTPARDEHPPVKMRIFCPAVEGAAPLPCVF
jgi:acetyl esterase/lipase